MELLTQFGSRDGTASSQRETRMADPFRPQRMGLVAQALPSKPLPAVSLPLSSHSCAAWVGKRLDWLPHRLRCLRPHHASALFHEVGQPGLQAFNGPRAEACGAVTHSGGLGAKVAVPATDWSIRARALISE